MFGGVFVGLKKGGFFELDGMRWDMFADIKNAD